MRLGRLECTGGFLLLLAWLNYIDSRFLLLQTLLACGLHELGHYAALRALGLRVTALRLTAAGAAMTVNHPMDYRQEGVAALAGPGANFLAAMLLCSIPACREFTRISLLLGAFNLLPAAPLDGGRALLATLSLVTDRDRAERAGEGLHLLTCLLLIPAGGTAALSTGNVTLLLVALWLCLLLKKDKKRGICTCNTDRKQVK